MPTLRINLLNDWHIGSGTGIPGDIDRTVRRDQNGLPYLPAKTIVGIWRDRCELVALAMDNQQPDGIWQQWLEYLFGSQPTIKKIPHKTPRPAILSVRSAHLPSALSEALQGKAYLQSALTFTKPGIKIDSRTGYVEQDCLRSQEMMRGNITLEARYELAGLEPDSAPYNTAQALLAAGAALVERLGSKRRRGSGRCELWIEGFSKTNALEWLRETPDEPVEFKLREGIGTTQPTGDADWYQLNLMLEAKQPLILNKRTIGNVVETLDYIPGSYLLPILARQMRQQLGVDLNEAIANEWLIITNAIVMVNGQTAKPIPLCLFQEKLEKQNIYNRLRSGSPTAQTKAIRQGYIAQVKDQKFLHITLDSKVETHNTVDDKTQRPNEEVGGVYSYQAIPTGTQFQAALRIKGNLITESSKAKPFSWQKCLEGHYAIGRAKKDEYGLVELKVEGEPTVLQPDQKAEDTPNVLTVWFLSDVLLRDRRLRPTTDITEFIRQLGDALETELEIVDSKSEDALSLFARQRRTDSWQTRWGLPRPSLVGLSAGSCMTLQVKEEHPPLTSANLARVAAQGFGERRVEGYGQLEFNHPLLQEPKPIVLKPEEERDAGGSLVSSQDACFNYACLVETEAWRDAIRRAALAVAVTSESRKEILGITVNKEMRESKPSLSQLGTLRSQISTLTNAERSKHQITRWLDHLKDQGKWTEKPLAQVRELITDSLCVWRHLDLQNHLGIVLDNDLVLTQRGQEQVKSELWAEAVQTLVDACIRAHKRDLETLKRQEQSNG